MIKIFVYEVINVSEKLTNKIAIHMNVLINSLCKSQSFFFCCSSILNEHLLFHPYSRRKRRNCVGKNWICSGLDTEIA